MCFSFEISMITFIVSWTISIYLLQKNINKVKRQNVIALMIFSSMQLVDAILHYINMKRNNINYYVTSLLIPIILSLQILENVFVRNKGSNSFINLICIIGCIYIFYRFNGYSSPLCNNALSSPIWGSNEIKLWELITFSFLCLYPSWNLIALFILIIFPLIYNFAGGAYGSLWCSIANVYAFYLLIIK